MSKCTYADCSEKVQTGCCLDCDRLESCTEVCHLIEDENIKDGEQCEYYEEDDIRHGKE